MEEMKAKETLKHFKIFWRGSNNTVSNLSTQKNFYNIFQTEGNLLKNSKYKGKQGSLKHFLPLKCHSYRTRCFQRQKKVPTDMTPILNSTTTLSFSKVLLKGEKAKNNSKDSKKLENPSLNQTELILTYSILEGTTWRSLFQNLFLLNREKKKD